ncbi:MAG: tRNA epoxyqueuosine(34) reductase QueG, partial [Planctomycetota bacterium]
KIARYAWGQADYHDLVHRKLKVLKKFCLELNPDGKVRGVVDTAPLLEREFAELAGLGWRARNSLLINRKQGSFLNLAAMLFDFELESDAPYLKNHCGNCTACLDACPTDAFEGPYVLNATKCISYLTIEHRSPVPKSLRTKMDNWVLGCDVCQDVCPWNQRSPRSSDPVFSPVEGHNSFDLRELFDLDDDQYRARFRKTPLWRPKRRGILRNAAIALGNYPDQENLGALAKGIEDTEPLVRGASAWALGRHPELEAINLLQQRKEIEQDRTVQEEILDAINSWNQ